MAGYVCRRRMLVSRRQWHRRPRVQEDLRPVWGRNSDGTSDRTAKATTVSQPAILTVFSGVRHLHTRVKSSASRAAANARRRRTIRLENWHGDPVLKLARPPAALRQP